MKNLIAIFSIGIIIVSCTKTEVKNITVKNNSDTLVTKKTFVIDSVKVEDSLVINKNLTTSFNKQLLVFPSIENKLILDSIYKEALVETKSYDKNSLQADLTKQMQKSFAKTREDSKEWSPEFKQTWDDTSAMKVISHKDNILTLLYSGSGYTGGAHGYYFGSYKVFDLNKNMVINQNDIIKDPKDLAWDKILKNHFDEPEQKEMLLEDKISPNNNFYFDDKKITFVYNQYEITAYAAGVVYITINFSEIKNMLKPEFLTQYKIK
ncbi:RsiV family protein [Epilithonimonas sp. UC225_85]|uniref:RsiV family protein n=1 Tax=Epilithonimonas sp. UC225_85 TaxID=3350167 RepID=UPI0036D36281